MSFLESIQSEVESDPQLQELVEEVGQAASLVQLILTALQLGRAIAVKVVEEMLNERGQAPEAECRQCVLSRRNMPLLCYVFFYIPVIAPT